MRERLFRDRIMELCKRIVAEHRPEKFTQLLAELDEVFKTYLSNPPPSSQFEREAQLLYKPDIVDVQWAAAMMKIISEGGLFVMPAAQLQYRVSHERKEMTLLNTEQLVDFAAFTTHIQTIATFKQIGYTVNEQR